MVGSKENYKFDLGVKGFELPCKSTKAQMSSGPFPLSSWYLMRTSKENGILLRIIY